jgi:hypothetical protein
MSATCRAHLILYILIILITFLWRVQVMNFSLCDFLHIPTISSFLSRNILLSSLISNNLNWQFIQHYKRTGSADQVLEVAEK